MHWQWIHAFIAAMCINNLRCVYPNSRNISYGDAGVKGTLVPFSSSTCQELTFKPSNVEALKTLVHGVIHTLLFAKNCFTV